MNPHCGYGSDGLRNRSMCRCVVWVAVGDLTYAQFMMRVVGERVT